MRPILLGKSVHHHTLQGVPPKKKCPSKDYFFKYENDNTLNDYEHRDIKPSLMCHRIFFL